MKLFVTFTFTISLFTWLVGCDGESTTTKEKPLIREEMMVDYNQEINISLLVPHTNAFLESYGDVFLNKFKNVHIEYVKTSDLWKIDKPVVKYYQDIINRVNETNPDVIWFQAMDGLYEQYADEGKLYDLGYFIKSDNEFEPERFHSSIADWLKDNNKGALYGLTPNFENYAIFYNKEIFEEYNVDYPSDDMSFEEILNIAKKFDKGNVSGLLVDYPYTFLRLAIDKPFIDQKNNEITVKKEWEKIITYFLDLYKKRIVSKTPSTGDADAQNPFLSGKAAMAIGSMRMLNNLTFYDDKFAVKKWDLVSLPNSQAIPTGIFAVNSNTKNPEDAWTFVKYVTNTRGHAYRLPSDPSKLDEKLAGKNIEAFYKKREDGRRVPSNETIQTMIPGGVEVSFINIMSKMFDEVLSGNETIENAVTSLQQEFEKVWYQAVLDAKKYE